MQCKKLIIVVIVFFSATVFFDSSIAQPVTPGLNVACDGGKDPISVDNNGNFTSAAIVTIQNVGGNDVLICNATLETDTDGTGKGRVEVRVQVTDANSDEFFAEPDPDGGSYVIGNTSPNILNSATWWIKPSDVSGFALGNVTLTLQATEYTPGNAATIGFRSFCCQKINNDPPVLQTKAVVVPLFD